MNRIRIFISSVQTEFAQERAALRDYLRDDPLMRKFFDVFLFEDVPASNLRPDSLYLDVENGLPTDSLLQRSNMSIECGLPTRCTPAECYV